MAIAKSTFEERFWSRVSRADGDGCWEWQASLFTGGYGRVAMPRSRKLDGAHRVAWRLVNGTIPDGLQVLHACDNRKCCRPDHLFVGTALDNMRDMIEKGRQSWASDKPISESQVRDIRARVEAGSRFKTLARELGLSRNRVRSIARRSSYRTVA